MGVAAPSHTRRPVRYPCESARLICSPCERRVCRENLWTYLLVLYLHPGIVSDRIALYDIFGSGIGSYAPQKTTDHAYA
ncbi:hypothetical protein D3C71_1275290 [compost metagenome]